MTKIKQKCLRSPESLLADLKVLAVKQGVTLNGLIVHVLWQYVNKMKGV